MAATSVHAMPVLRRGLAAIVRWGAIGCGFLLLARYGMEAQGGYDLIFTFCRTLQSRFTSMGMITGTLHVRNELSTLGFDEQVYNGAAYTNWGFGVPLMELPFHAWTYLFRNHTFFPDRAIFFFYFLLAAALSWAAFARLSGMRAYARSGWGRGVQSWAATGAVITIALFPLMSCRFYIYEETIAYFVLCQLMALAAWIFTRRSSSVFASLGLGIAAGLGLLVRPTGLFYVGMWTSIVLLDRMPRRAIVAYCAGLAPLTAFWCFGNWVRGGSLLSTGFANTYHNILVQEAQQRFGSTCLSSFDRVETIAHSIFQALFIGVPDTNLPWMQQCFFTYEERPPAGHDPFLGLTALVLLVGMLTHYVVRRERRLVLYMPFVTVALLYSAYVYAGAGVAWRYAGDFWPAIFVAVAEYVRTLPVGANRALGLPATAVLLACAVGAREADQKLPWRPGGNYGTRWEVVSQNGDDMWKQFSSMRWKKPAPLPSSYHNGQHLDAPPGEGQGWSSDGSVEAASNLYVGVPEKGDDRYELRLETEGMTMPSVRVYVNGAYYVAQRHGDVYSTPVQIVYKRLSSPIVNVTVQWSRDRPPLGKFVSVSLL